MIIKNNKSIYTLFLYLVISLFSCKAHKDTMYMEGNKKPGEDEISNMEKSKFIKTEILPIDQTNIQDVLSSGYYADKTMFAAKLLIQGTSTFIIRPHGFGKTLLIDTIEKIAEGEVSKELFKNCFICNGAFKYRNNNSFKYDWKKYPVIRLNFSKLDNTNYDTLKYSLKDLLYNIAQKYGVASKMYDPKGNDSIGSYYQDLLYNLNKLNNGYEPKTIVLIDAYDSPLVNLEWDSAIYNDCISMMDYFFSVVKGCANECKLVFVTGVYSFFLPELGSGINCLYDRSTDKDFANVAGYSQKDVQKLFTDRLPYVKEQLEKNTNKNYTDEEIMQNVQQYYNGYKFSDLGPSVYNPTSVLYFFSEGNLKSYCNRIKDHNFLLKKTINRISKSAIYSDTSIFTVDRYKIYNPRKNIYGLDIISLMYQMGCLTLDRYNDHDKEYILKFPNKEVREMLAENLPD